VPPSGYERDVVGTEDSVYWHAVLLDQVRSLRNAVVLLGILAVGALGVAVWALLSEEDGGGGGRAASQTDVTALESRVDGLEQEIGRAASRDDVTRLSRDLDSLDARVGTLEDTVESPQQGGAGADQQAVEELQADVQQLGASVQDIERRLGRLEQQQGAP
jgi:polyhydroxyalkanoate synthesis regulator phasin